MLKVHILSKCSRYNREAYLPIGEGNIEADPWFTFPITATVAPMQFGNLVHTARVTFPGYPNLLNNFAMDSAALAAGENPKELLDALMAGLMTCGDRFEQGEYFLPELMGAGDAFKAGLDIVAPKLAAGDRVSQGKVLLGTVHGDVHDIGKNLVRFMLESAGFTVVNLGSNVSPEAIVQAVRDHQPQVLGISALLTTTMLGMEDVIKEFKNQGLRDKVKVVIGSGLVSKKYAEDIGADGYGNDAAQAVTLVRSLL